MNETKIVYCNFESPLGEMIAGATETGVCFLEWHDRGGVERIKERVVKRYRAQLEEGSNRHLKLLRSELEKYFQGKLEKFLVPVDVKGTPFEKRDWEQLMKIPYGVTISYGELARRMGNVNASRAVGRANGANYLSIVIPCHRVIEANGKLRGYGGGLWRKQYLIELEAGAQPETLDFLLQSSARQPGSLSIR